MNNHVPPGYKQTEVGVIPEEWEVAPLEAITTHIGDGLHGTPVYCMNGGYPFINGNNLHNGNIVVTSDTKAVDHSEFIKHRKPLSDRSILMSINGTIGNLALFNGDSIVLGKSAAYLNVKQEVSKHFVYHSLQTQIVKRQFFDGLTGSTIGNLGLATIRNAQIPIPPTEDEQRAIAEALSDVAALLGGLDRLITKKRDLKQAVMQQLLTGQTRLPGFHGEWEVKRLGDVGAFLKGSGVKKDEAKSGNLPCIRYGEIYTHHNDYIKSFNSWISSEVAAAATQLKQGDLLFAGSGETKEEIGKCVAFIDNFEAYAGGDIVILRLTDANPMFMGYYCNIVPINAQKASKGQGDAVVHISAAALSNVVVSLPSVREQAAIAAVLSDMDADLAALEARRDKTRALKQGMMQELLTGRTRLVASPTNVVAVDFASKTKSTPTRQLVTKSHNWQINEAVVVAVLVKKFGSEQYPLGRKRCTKLAYLMHRHVEHVAEGYRKKAAGPYNPDVKYKGPEGIAQKNGYIRTHTNGKFSGFVAAKNIAQAEDYFQEWYGQDVLDWLEQFRKQTNDELELLATVDMAVEDLKRLNQRVGVETVKSVIRNHPEWEAKLERVIFSDINIARAIRRAGELFPTGDIP